MADIAGWVSPQGTITLYSNVSWDSQHQNAFYFTSQSQLDGYLGGLNHYDYHNTQYTRVENGIVKVRDVEGNIRRCNYLKFNNGSTLNNKSYYAFIDYTEYDNNNCTIIHYSIDYLTTYWLDMVFDHCYIVRQHGRTDEVGENIVPEPISINTMAVTSTTQSQLSGGSKWGFGCIVATSRDTDGETEEPKIYNGNSVIDNFGSFQGIFQGLYIHCYSSTQVKMGLPQSHISDMMGNGGTESDIRYILAVPDVILEQILNESHSVNMPYLVTLPTDIGEENAIKHTVRNKKLLTAPFTYLSVTGDNKTAEYQFENFTSKPQAGDAVTFYVTGGTLTPDCTVKCSPYGYESVSGVDFVQGISLMPFPSVYWAANNNVTRQNVSGIIGTIAGAGAAVAGIAMENPAIVVGGVSAAISSVAQTVVANKLNTVASGGSAGDSNDLVHNQKEFYFRVITPSYADSERIDNFFDMYGYAQNTVAVPNFNARPHYTYVQLGTVNVRGLMPENARSEIISIMKRGCTFWNNATEVGNYNLDNTV